MKVLHVTDFFLPRLGGIEVQVADLAVRQAARGDDVTVLTNTSGGPEHDPPGVRVLRLHDGGERAVRPLLALRKAGLVRGGYDVVHVHVGIGTVLGYVAARAAGRAGIPTAATVHSFWTGYHWLFKGSDAILRVTPLPIAWSAVSEAAADSLRELVDVPVSVLPNGTEVGAWHVEHEPREPDEVVLVAVMRLAPRKRPLPLVDVMARVRERVPADVRIRLVVVGDGPSCDKVARAVHRRGLDDVVVLAGRLTHEQIRDLYRRADAFVAPARLESFGIAALEARCAGVPVVARKDTGVGTFVEHGRNGLLVADDDELADALVALCADPALRAELADQPAPAEFDWPRVIAATDALYERALALEPAGVRA